MNTTFIVLFRNFLAVFIFIFLILLLSQKAFAAISFSINVDKQTFIKEEEIPIQVTITGLTSCTTCYLQVALTGQGTPKYFGKTQKNSGEWYSYISSPAPDVIQATFFSFQPSNGEWSGTIKAKIDKDDPDYKGEGQYNLKLLRYTGNSSSSAGDSNEVLISIIGDPPTPTLTPTPTNSPTPTRTPTPTKTPTPTPTPKLQATEKPSTPTPTKSSSTSVLGSTTAPKASPSSTSTQFRLTSNKNSKKDILDGVNTTKSSSPPAEKAEATKTQVLAATSEKPNNNTLALFSIIGGGASLIACSILLYRKYRSN